MADIFQMSAIIRTGDFNRHVFYSHQISSKKLFILIQK